MEKEELLEKWKFRWPLMEVFIEGKSSIDLSDLEVEDEVEAERFMESYGYDMAKVENQRLGHAMIIEALFVIETQLMKTEWQKRGIKPPTEVSSCSDVRTLLIYASNSSKKDAWIRVWACAVLRIMHTLAHIEGVGRMADVPLVRDQIIGRFEKALFRDDEGNLRFGDPSQSVEVERVDWKVRKPRTSIILKLLHKPANVAETIYDYLGVRIITKNRVDAMHVVKLLRTHFLVTFANTNPSRARNTLMELSSFKEQVTMITKQLEEGRISPDEFMKRLEETYWHYPSTGRKKAPVNPHSGASYRSIQLTCRQLITYQNPALDFLRKVQQDPCLDSQPVGKTLRKLSKWGLEWNQNKDRSEVKIFYPFELQIFDLETWKGMQSSDAAHAHYKKSQIRAARRRVVSEILVIAKKGGHKSSES